METRQNVEKFKVKSRNILAQETLRQNVSMDLPPQLNKKFNHMSYKSGKSLLVELIFGVLKRAGGCQRQCYSTDTL